MPFVKGDGHTSPHDIVLTIPQGMRLKSVCHYCDTEACVLSTAVCTSYPDIAVGVTIQQGNFSKYGGQCPPWSGDIAARDAPLYLVGSVYMAASTGVNHFLSAFMEPI